MQEIILAAGEGVSASVIVSMMWIAIASLLAPLLSFMTGKRIPGVVFMLVLGVIIGPEVLNLAQSDGSNALLRELGLGMLFLLAGWEIDPETLHGKQGRTATMTWLVSLVVAFAGALTVVGRDDMLTSVVLAIAVSSTALGTLLPVIKAAGVNEAPVGKSFMVHGAVGELGPVLAMALLLSTRATWLTLLLLVVFLGGALVVAFVPRTVAKLVPWFNRAMLDGASHTNQTVMRLVIVLLTVLMALAAVFELDVVLGAFAAGIILRALVPARTRKTLEARLDVMGYGLFIPVFFVTSGMAIKVSAVLDSLGLVALAVVVILVARGLPVLFMEMFTDTGSGITGFKSQVQLALYSATGLPIIVAVTEIALGRELIDERMASVLVAAGAITVLLFPFLAMLADSYLPSDLKEEQKNKKEAATAEHVAAADSKELKENDAAAQASEQAAAQPKPKPRSTTIAEDEITLDDDHPSNQ